MLLDKEFMELKIDILYDLSENKNTFLDEKSFLSYRNVTFYITPTDALAFDQGDSLQTNALKKLCIECLR